MFVRFLVFLLAVSSMAFGVEYASGVKSIYLNKGDSKAIGRILPTSAVNVIKKDGDMVLVSLEGYMQEGVDGAVYYVAGQRILSVGLVKNSGVEIKVLSTQKVDGKNYNKVSLQAWTDNKDLTNDLDGLYAKANTLFSENCSMCHGLHPIKEFKANQWPSVFKSMVGRTGIDKKDHFLVTQYLQKHAGDMQK